MAVKPILLEILCLKSCVTCYDPGWHLIGSRVSSVVKAVAKLGKKGLVWSLSAMIIGLPKSI